MLQVHSGLSPTSSCHQNNSFSITRTTLTTRASSGPRPQCSDTAWCWKACKFLWKKKSAFFQVCRQRLISRSIVLIFFLDGRCVIIFIVLRGWIMACYFVSMVDWQWTDWKAVGGKFYFRVPSYHSKSPCIFFIPQPFSICFTGKVGHQVVIGLVLYLIGSTGGASL